MNLKVKKIVADMFALHMKSVVLKKGSTKPKNSPAEALRFAIEFGVTGKK